MKEKFNLFLAAALMAALVLSFAACGDGDDDSTTGNGGPGNSNTVATPTANPAAGAVAAGTSVQLSCATAGAEIFYTTDGSAALADFDAYSSSIAINSATTIRAYAKKSGMKDSKVLTAVYTIDNNQGPVFSFNGTVDFAGATLGDLADGYAYSGPVFSGTFWKYPPAGTFTEAVSDAPTGSTTPSLKFTATNGEGWGFVWGCSDFFPEPYYADLSVYTSVDITVKKSIPNADFKVIFTDYLSVNGGAREIGAQISTTAADTWETVNIPMTGFAVNNTGSASGCDKTKMMNLAWGTGAATGAALGDVYINSYKFNQ